MIFLKLLHIIWFLDFIYNKTEFLLYFNILGPITIRPNIPPASASIGVIKSPFAKNNPDYQKMRAIILIKNPEYGDLLIDYRKQYKLIIEEIQGVFFIIDKLEQKQDYKGLIELILDIMFRFIELAVTDRVGNWKKICDLDKSNWLNLINYTFAFLGSSLGLSLPLALVQSKCSRLQNKVFQINYNILEDFYFIYSIGRYGISNKGLFCHTEFSCFIGHKALPLAIRRENSIDEKRIIECFYDWLIFLYDFCNDVLPDIENELILCAYNELIEIEKQYKKIIKKV